MSRNEALGDSAFQAFDYASALRYYGAAFRKDSSRFELRLKMSRANYDLGLDLVAEGEKSAARKCFDQSVRHARQLTELFPESAISYFMLAATTGNLALFAGGRDKVLLGRQVEAYSKRAIALDSTLAFPYVSLGIYYREVSRLNWLERMIARTFFGRLPSTDTSEILALLHHAEHLRPNFPFLHFELAKTYAYLDQPKEAIVHLEKMQSLQPETAQDIRNQRDAIEMMAELRRER